MHEADRGRMQLMAIIAMAGVVVGTGGSRETSHAGQGREGEACPDSPAAAEPFATVLSDSGKIYRGTFAPAGDELWFFKKVSADPRSEDYRIFVSRRGSTGWSRGERVDLGGEFSDLYPTLSSDGRRLVFASYRRAPGDTATRAQRRPLVRRRGRRAAGAIRPSCARRDPAWARTTRSRTVARDGTAVTSAGPPPTGTPPRPSPAPPAGRGFGAPPVPYAPVERWRAWRDSPVRSGAATPAPDTSFVLLEVSGDAIRGNADEPATVRPAG